MQSLRALSSSQVTKPLCQCTQLRPSGGMCLLSFFEPEVTSVASLQILLALRDSQFEDFVLVCLQPTVACVAALQSLLALSDSQVRDLMLVRQLYLTKRGLLAMERKALANQMAAEGAMTHPSDNITRMADLTTCLKDNAAEDHHVHRKMARAMFRGVSFVPSGGYY